MSRRQLQSKLAPPLVRLGTLRDMGLVAKKLAVARKAIEEIRRIEDDLIKKGKEDMRVFKQEMAWTATMAKNAGHAAEDSIVLLKGIKVKVEQYLRELNATN